MSDVSSTSTSTSAAETLSSSVLQDEKSLYAFTRPVMDEGERIRQTILFGLLMLVSIVILLSTIAAYFYLRHRNRRLEQAKALEGDAERVPQDPHASTRRINVPPAYTTRPVPAKKAPKKVERPQSDRTWSMYSTDLDD